MVHQNAVIWGEVSVRTTVHEQFFAANLDVGIAAGHKLPRGLARRRTGDLPGRRNAGPVAVRNHDSVRADGGFNPPQQQVVGAAATRFERKRAEAQARPKKLPVTHTTTLYSALHHKVNRIGTNYRVPFVQRSRRNRAAIFGSRSLVKTPFRFKPPARMMDWPVLKSAKFQMCIPAM